MKDLCFEFFLLLILVFLMAFLWKCNGLLTCIFIGCYLALLEIWHTPVDIVLFIITFLFFWIGEVIMVYSGAWAYNNPSYFGIPIWIPFSWGFVSVIIRRISLSLTNIFGEKSNDM